MTQAEEKPFLDEALVADEATVLNDPSDILSHSESLREALFMYFPDVFHDKPEAISHLQEETKGEVEKSLKRYERANTVFEARIQQLIQQYWDGDLSVNNAVKDEAVRRIASLPKNQRTRCIQHAMKDGWRACEAVKYHGLTPMAYTHPNTYHSSFAWAESVFP